MNDDKILKNYLIAYFVIATLLLIGFICSTVKVINNNLYKNNSIVELY